MAKKKWKKNPAQVVGSGPPVVSSFATLKIGAESGTEQRLTEKNIVAEFHRYFGKANDLGNWQRLCHDVGIEENPPSITTCKQALKGVWINIYDLLDAVNTNSTPPRRFPSQKALAEYTISHHRVYPRKKAKEGGPVRALMAHIFH